MSNRIPDDVRQEIADAVADERSYRDVADEYGCAPSTVSKIAREYDIKADRTQTRKATEALEADNASRRARLASALLEDAEKLRRQLWEPCIVYSFGGKHNTYAEHELSEPPSADKRNLMTTLAIALDKSMKLERFDQDERGLAAVDAWLQDVMGERDAS